MAVERSRGRHTEVERGGAARRILYPLCCVWNDTEIARFPTLGAESGSSDGGDHEHEISRRALRTRAARAPRGGRASVDEARGSPPGQAVVRERAVATKALR